MENTLKQTVLTRKPILKLQLWSRGLSIVVAFVGLAVLVGWQFDIDFLKRPLQNLVAMNPATAGCFILSSLSLFLLTNKTKVKK